MGKLQSVSRRDLEKLGAEELAIKYDVHPQTAWRWKRDYGNQKKSKKQREKIKDISQFKLTPEMVSDLFLPDEAFSDRYGVPLRVVSSLKKFLGVDSRELGEYSQDFRDVAIRHSLSWEEISDLHTLTYRQLQEKYGWSSSTIAKYRKIVGASTCIVLKDCTVGMRRRVEEVVYRSDKYWEERKKNDLRYRKR